MTPTLTVSVVGSAAIEQPTAPTSRWQPKLKLGKVLEKIVSRRPSSATRTGEAETEVFAGYAQDLEPTSSGEACGVCPDLEELTTQDVVWRGMAVIDGGATQTIGSVAAVEAVLEQNRRKHGGSRLVGVSTQNPPTFFSATYREPLFEYGQRDGSGKWCPRRAQDPHPRPRP